ncbi:MAG: metallophosphoesterase family protein [Planctomycetaceae bacterium]|jgi:predicted MPP superfamily phosphohydrolase|nr:metallophosphoesterase family protein [Planctomycetaceae bacterium]
MKRRDFIKAGFSSPLSIGAGLAILNENTTASEKIITPLLRFSDNGTFKIAQITDTHYRTDKNIAKESVRLIEEIIDTEKPQLVVYTGDIVVSGNIRQGWDEILAPCIERKTYWAVVLGNHDHESYWSRQQIIDHIKDKPYSVTESGPDNIKGAGNYVLEIVDSDNKIAALLYCMDSNAYSSLKGVKGYDWFSPDQITWYKKQSTEYTQKNNNTPLPSLAFFHIPLNEYGEMIHYKRTIIGDRGENECPGAVNSGMFLAMLESRDIMGVFTGHDHVNDYIGLWHNIALGYGRFSGTKTTYVKEPHGSRIIEISNSRKRTFKTWIRLRNGEILHSIQVPQDLSKEEEKS